MPSNRVITFKASKRLIEQMDLTAMKLGITRSDLIRNAIRQYIERVNASNDIYINENKVSVVVS